jgi:hypothetical protein
MTSIPLSDMEGGGSAVRFDAFGDKCVGTITAMKETRQTDPKTGQPKFFPSGDPMTLWIITLQPDEGGDPVSLWAKAGKFTAHKGSGDAMLVAIGKAVRAAGASSVDVGGHLAVAFTGESEPKPGMSPAKLFTAQYAPPAPEPASVPVDLFNG